MSWKQRERLEVKGSISKSDEGQVGLQGVRSVNLRDRIDSLESERENPRGGQSSSGSNLGARFLHGRELGFPELEQPAYAMQFEVRSFISSCSPKFDDISASRKT